MKKLTLTLAALMLILGPSLAWTADEPSTQPSPGAAGNAPSNTSNMPSMGTSQAAQTPPENWTSLKGTVQSVDTTSKTVQIKDDTGNLLQVPIDKQVSIKKNGERIKLTQVQPGDIIVALL